MLKFSDKKIGQIFSLFLSKNLYIIEGDEIYANY
jgi:hypothetical protein